MLFHKNKSWIKLSPNSLTAAAVASIAGDLAAFDVRPTAHTNGTTDTHHQHYSSCPPCGAHRLPLRIDWSELFQLAAAVCVLAAEPRARLAKRYAAALQRSAATAGPVYLGDLHTAARCFGCVHPLYRRQAALLCELDDNDGGIGLGIGGQIVLAVCDAFSGRNYGEYRVGDDADSAAGGQHDDDDLLWLANGCVVADAAGDWLPGCGASEAPPLGEHRFGMQTLGGNWAAVDAGELLAHGGQLSNCGANFVVFFG